MFVLVALRCIGEVAAQEASPPVAPEPAAPAAPAATTAAPAAPAEIAVDPAPPADPAAPPAEVAAPVTPALRVLDDPTAPRGWRVVDASGAPVDSAALATALGDDGTLRKLRAARTFATVQTGALIGVGVGLATAGVVELVLAGPEVEVGERPDPVAYQTWAEWREQADLWETRLARADTRDERAWIGATFLTGAVFAGALIPITGRDAKARAEHPSLMWDRATLDRLLAPQVAIGPTSVSLSWVMP
jgi:hypothetical protein